MAVAPKGVKKDSLSKGLHASLMAVGMTPGPQSVVADVLDSVLYATEGKYKESLWSLVAAVPFIGGIGTMVKYGKANRWKKSHDKLVETLGAARHDAGHVHLLRGVKTNPRETIDRMIEGRLVRGGSDYGGNIFTSQSPWVASGYQDQKKWGKLAERYIIGAPLSSRQLDEMSAFMARAPEGGSMLHFRIPEKEMLDVARGGELWRNMGRIGEGVGSRGILVPGAREVELTGDVLEEWLHKIYRAEDVGIRQKLPERFGR